MATNYTQAGEVVTLVAPSGGVVSGAGVRVGVCFGVALHDAAAGADVEVQRRGVFTLPKVSAQAWTQGAAIYWDDDAVGGAVATTATTAGNILIGFAAAAAANPSATGSVVLTGAAPAAVTI